METLTVAVSVLKADVEVFPTVWMINLHTPVLEPADGAVLQYHHSTTCAIPLVHHAV